MYNQPTTRLPNGTHVGTLYKNPIDCLWKTLKTEGPLALYKGGDFVVQVNRNPTHPPTRVDRSLPPNCTSYVRLPTSASTGSTDCLSFRIITLTANDLLLNLYKKFANGQ